MQKTWEKFGLEKISELALENATAIAALIHWNHVHGIRFFRYDPQQLLLRVFFLR